ncbi:MAG: 1-pyrroline-5-carboxylate dehydrogenase [Saprospiraceae bacterium]|jgi:1-pyrroline-5-carboxylate dehydrogenase
MANAFYKVPTPGNEAVKGYAPNSPEKADLKATLADYKNTQTEIPMVINGKAVKTDNHVTIHPPHDHKHTLGFCHYGNASHVQDAIDAALAAKADWQSMAWEQRAAIFLRAAALIAGPYRAKINATTMLAQSKNAMQAEIDAACEYIDFLKFNVHYAEQIYSEQPPMNPDGIWNRLEYRPLEGFIFAVTPFNFTSIAGNLCAAPAMLGNTVVWKPSDTQIYSAAVLMEVFQEAGLPDGVINMVFCDGPEAGNVVFNHRELAGLHFTGSTKTFQHMWKTIGENIQNYRSYPRIVGETGGKDFVMVHNSSNAKQVSTALSRGAFEFQGQKCSAASRAYVPQSLWADVRAGLEADLADFKMGTPEDFSNFVNAVIDERSFDKLASFIDQAKVDKDAEVIIGGNHDKSVGYFIEPTVILAKDPKYTTMETELFGPVLTIYVYEDDKFEETLHILDETSPYALTGAIFSKDRAAVQLASDILYNAAGNLYINDKPTGAVVGQQPFGGARGSGTNDKAGAPINLYRWISPRTIKENFNPPSDYRYEFLEEA